MTVRQVGNPPRPESLVIPNFPTTVLQFDAIADVAGARISVVYTIRSPSGVTFDNGSTSKTLSNFAVGVTKPETVPFVVTFKGATTQTAIDVGGVVFDHSGGQGFPLTWNIPVTIAASRLAASTSAALRSIATGTDVVHPATEAAALIRRLQALLPALEAISSVSDPTATSAVIAAPAAKKASSASAVKEGGRAKNASGKRKKP